MSPLARVVRRFEVHVADARELRQVEAKVAAAVQAQPPGTVVSTTDRVEHPPLMEVRLEGSEPGVLGVMADLTSAYDGRIRNDVVKVRGAGPGRGPEYPDPGIRLRIPSGRVGSAYLELARRHGDFAVAGVGALLSLSGSGAVDDARVVLIGVRDTAIRSVAAEGALVGREPVEEVFAEAAEAIDPEIEPVSDLHGSSDYRRHVAKVLVRRALEQAHERALEATS